MPTEGEAGAEMSLEDRDIQSFQTTKEHLSFPQTYEVHSPLLIGGAGAEVVPRREHREAEVLRSQRVNLASTLHHLRACLASLPARAGVAGIPRTGWGGTPVTTRPPPSSSRAAQRATWAGTCARSAVGPTSGPHRPSGNMSRPAEAGAVPHLLQAEAVEEPRHEA